jgi:hypothetical protein
MKLIWYGERGVVNAIVTYLAEMPDGAKQFLRCVKWADGSSPAWIENIDDAKTQCIVELYLAEFGNPDLIIVCQTFKGERFWVFVEAKVVGYLKSIVPNTLGMNDPGFNSGCNGQLSLKYRFSQALKRWDGGTVDGIKEPESILQAYRRDASIGVADPKVTPRKLLNPRILKQILKPLMNRDEPLDDKYFHFVALTHDSGPFFTSVSDNLPKFLDERGQDVFEQWKGRIGWIGYELLAKNAECKGLREAFEPTLKLMVPSLAPERQRSETSREKIPGLGRPPAIKMLPSNIQELIGKIDHEVIKFLGSGHLLEREGSRSIIDVARSKRVIGKIVPQGNDMNCRLWLGISPLCGFSPEECVDLTSELRLSPGQNPQVFSFVILPDSPTEALATVRAIIERIKWFLDFGPGA